MSGKRNFGKAIAGILTAAMLAASAQSTVYAAASEGSERTLPVRMEAAGSEGSPSGQSVGEEPVLAAKSTDAVNQAVEARIRSFQGKYPEGSVWNGKFDKKGACWGFALLMANEVFGAYPANSRGAANGISSNGWTCYYVNASNCNTLTVEPGDLIDAPTDLSHTAMVLSVAGGVITCVQCNWTKKIPNGVFWREKFNYYPSDTTLARIYARWGGGSRVIRLWKPSENLKKNAVKVEEADKVSPQLGAVAIASSAAGLTFSCPATDNVGITEAWAVVTAAGNKSQRFHANVSPNAVYGDWSNGFAPGSEQFTVTVYAKDAAGNVGSSSASVDLKVEVTLSPKESTIKVGEKTKIEAQVNQTLYTNVSASFSCSDQSGSIVKANYGEGGGRYSAEVTGLRPGAVSFEFECDYSMRTTVDGAVYESIGVVSYPAFVYIVPDAPTVTSITYEQHQYDKISYTPVSYADSYELYRLREGVDSEYQLLTAFKNDGSNSYRAARSADGRSYSYQIRAKAAEVADPKGGMYCPTSAFSNALSSTVKEEEITGFQVDPVEPQDFTGGEVRPKVSVYYNGTPLTEQLDYSVSYRDNVNASASAPTVIVTGKGDAKGKVTLHFEILPKDISGEDVAVSSLTARFDGNEKQPAPVLSYRGKKLKKGRDYTVASDACRAPGSIEFVVRGRGNYQGERNLTFTITGDRPLSKTTVAKIPGQTYQGSEVSPTPVVKDGKRVLTAGVDYSVSYRDNVQAGTAKLTLTGIPSGGYTGAKTVSFKIKPCSVKSAQVKVELAASYPLAPGGCKPEPVVTFQGKPLVKGVDYTLSYRNNKKASAVTSGKKAPAVVIKGRGNFGGSCERTFMITQQ